MKETKIVMPETAKRNKISRSHYGEFGIDVPQDRESSFEPMVVQKGKKIFQKLIKIISMYARGLTTRQISDQIENLDLKLSEGFVSDVTDKILQDIDDWQRRPLAGNLSDCIY